MPAKRPEKTSSNDPRRALMVVLYPMEGRASIVEQPSTSPEFAEILERMSCDGIKRMSSSR
jgi:hypothetical protein